MAKKKKDSSLFAANDLFTLGLVVTLGLFVLLFLA